MASSSNSTRHPLILLLTALFITLAISDPNAHCYDPSGTFAPGLYPCDPSAFITNCCPQGWTCFSNALCVVTSPSNSFPNLTAGAVMRSACTNPLWNSAICGDRCLDKDNLSGDILACGSDRFCCMGDYMNGKCSCTGTPGGAFSIPPGRAQTVLGVSGTTFTGSPSYRTVPPTRPPTTTATSRPTTLATTASGKGSNTTAGAYTNGTTVGSPTATGTGLPSPTESSSAAGSDAGSGSTGPSLGAKVGAGVGGAVGGLLVLGLITFAVVKVVKRRQERAGFALNTDIGDNDDDSGRPPVVHYAAAAAGGPGVGAPPGGPMFAARAG